jgi:hypothetical protein
VAAAAVPVETCATDTATAAATIRIASALASLLRMYGFLSGKRSPARDRGTGVWVFERGAYES